MKVSLKIGGDLLQGEPIFKFTFEGASPLKCAGPSAMEIMGRSLDKSFDTLIIPTMFDKRTNAALASRKRLMSDYGERVWHGVIPVDTHFRDASLIQLPISAAYPKTRGVTAYSKLLKVLEK